MKEMIAIMAVKLGIKAAYWIAGRIKARRVTKAIHAEVDKQGETAREQPPEMPCADV